ncbi:helix-turn-helix domain-containing protein [Chloroflexota bacterium]
MNGALRRIRELRALSQRELAAKSKINVATVNRIEAGHHKPRPSTIRKLAKALKVEPEELLSKQTRLLD